MKTTPLLLLPLLAAALAGCISTVNVRKVEPGKAPRGMRYHLPEPLVVGRPQPDGKIEYTIEYMPNLEREYAVDAWSFMASHSVKLSRSPQMLLTKAELVQNTTEVAKQLIDSVGKVGAEAATQIGAQKTAEATAAKAAATARTTAQTAAANTLQEKKNAVVLAQDKVAEAEKRLATATAGGDATKIAAAEASVAEAKIKLQEALRAVEFARNNLENFDDPTFVPSTPPGATLQTMPGPVFYRIVENPRTGGVRLVPIGFKFGDPRHGKSLLQERFQTITPATKEEKEKPKPAPAKPAPSSNTLDTPTASLSLPADDEHTVNVERTLVKSVKDESDATALFALTPSEDKKTLVIKRKGAPAAGKYRVLMGQDAATGGFTTKTVVITVK